MTVHSVLFHTRLSHFLVTVDESINNDLEIELQTPLDQVWKSCQIDDKFLEVLLDAVYATSMWTLESEFDLRECLGTPLHASIPKTPGIYRDGPWLNIVGSYDSGSGADDDLWVWRFNRSRF